MQDYTVTVQKIEYITDDVVFMVLNRPENLDFKAGQFITIEIHNHGKRRLKSYSILSEPSKKDVLDFGIKIIPEGFASEIFAKTKAGDTFNIKGPFGRFYFENSDVQEFVFIGTGTGITPLYSMIKEFVSQHSNKKFTLLVGYRYKKNILFDKELKQLEKENANFTYKVTLTREENWDGLKGRVQEHLTGELKNKKYYICGLKEMVVETRKRLEEAGISKENIDFERYS